MSFISKWKQVKRSGAFRRKTKKIYENLLRDNISVNNAKTDGNDFQEMTTLQTADVGVVSEQGKNTIDFGTEKQEDNELT